MVEKKNEKLLQTNKKKCDPLTNQRFKNLIQIILRVKKGNYVILSSDCLFSANKVAVDTFAKDIKRTRLEDITGNVKGVQYSLTKYVNSIIIKSVKKLTVYKDINI